MRRRVRTLLAPGCQQPAEPVMAIGNRFCRVCWRREEGLRARASTRCRAAQGNADRARPDQKLQGPEGRQRRIDRAARRRGGRPARTERRRQDDMLLHGHRAGAGRQGHDPHRRLRRHQMPMYRRARLGVGYLPQEASIFRGLTVESNIRAVLEVVEKSRKERERASTHCWKNSTSRICARRPRSRCRVVNGGGWKSPGRWPPSRTTCCSTNLSPASIRSR